MYILYDVIRSVGNSESNGLGTATEDLRKWTGDGVLDISCHATVIF